MQMLIAPPEQTAFFDLLDRALRGARVRFLLPDRVVDAGRSAAPPGQVDFVLRVSDPGFVRRVLAEGNLGLAETFMAEGWKLEQGTLEGFLTLLARSRLDLHVKRDPEVLLRAAALRARQLLRGSRANVRAHYDIGDDLYACFLDETRGYTCGYQASPSDTSEQLQENKYERICRKLRLREGESLIDLGCGYGGLMIHAAQHHGVRAHGITNSEDHCHFARRRVAELGLTGRVTIEQGDLREARGTFDKVVSVGVLEHFYAHEVPAFVGAAARVLHPDGFGLIHAIGCVTPKNDPDPFIQKHIFPGSSQKPLSLIVRDLERAGLAALDVENMRGHYAPTAQAWLDRFRANRHTLDPRRYDGAFQRMWEYYLALGVAAASATDSALFQVLFTKNYRRELPLVRV